MARRLAPSLAIYWICLGAAPAAADEPFAVVRDQVRIERGDRVVAPVAVGSDADVSPPDGGVRVDVERNRLRGRDPATGAERWSSSLPAGRRLETLARSPTTLFARWWKRGLVDGEAAAPAENEDPAAWVVDEPTLLRRLSLADGRWLEPLEVSGGHVRSVVIDERGVVVISDPTAGAYRVTSFEPGKTTPLWSKIFHSAPRRRAELDYVANLAALSHDSTDTTREIVPAGDQLVLCAGESQELLTLDRASGETLWEIDRVWEFERYHEKPNLFGWYVRRATPKDARADLARRSRIVAGPFVVLTGTERRVFVAVARDREEGTGDPVPEGVAYELEGGDVVSVTRLPQPVLTRGSGVFGDGVLWRCAHDALALQLPSHPTDGGWNGIGSTDRSGALRWYREPGEPSKVDAWLTTETPAGDLALGSDATYGTVGGAFIRTKGEKAFRVRMRRTALATGLETDFTLVVPFTGELPSWKGTNHSETSEGSEKEKVAIEHPWGVRTGQLTVRGDRFVVEIGWQGGPSFFAAFPIEALR